jgi:hypothetical protein
MPDIKNVTDIDWFLINEFYKTFYRITGILLRYFEWLKILIPGLDTNMPSSTYPPDDSTNVVIIWLYLFSFNENYV